MSQVDNFFTQEEFSHMTLEELKRVADYLEIKYPKNVKKAALIAAFGEKHQDLYGLAELSSPAPATMSVRVRRIYDQLNGGNSNGT